jgi:hypothetical protein
MTQIIVLFQPIIQRVQDWQREQRITRMSNKLSTLADRRQAALDTFNAMSTEISSRSIEQVQRMEKKGGLI